MDNLWLVALAALALIIAGVLVRAASKPDTFKVAHSAIIAAPPERIFPLIDSLHEFNRWNPFLVHDPATRIEYFGPEHGVGAGHRWDGNRKVGAGSIEVVESRPSSDIVMKLHMLKPMAARNRVEFALRPSGAGTEVTWTMSGRQPFIGKLMSMFMDCDGMVTGAFERGLASLKALAEAPGATRPVSSAAASRST